MKAKRHKEIQSFDKKVISYREFALSERPLGILHIIHDSGESMARYEEFCELLNSHRILTFGCDLRGNGLTDSKNPGHSDGDFFASSLKDNAVLAKKYSESYPEQKQVVMGVGSGVWLAEAFISRYLRFSAAAIFVEPRPKVNFFCVLPLAKALSKLKPDKRSNTLKKLCEKENLDKERKYEFSNNYYYRYLVGRKASEHINCALSTDVNLPVLVLSGEEEKFINSAQTTEKRYSVAGLKSVKLITYPKERDILFEKCKRKVFIDILNFLKELFIE